MASNTTNISLVNLDFEYLKNGFKDFLKAQSNFKDYDLEGSNINVLLDLLAYNTYLNGFYLNMVSNEMFLDSAKLKESIVARIKELNYVPRSFTSAQADVQIVIETDGSVASVIMPKGTTFTSRVGSNSFTFSTDQNIIISGSNNTFTSNTITIYEGQYVTDTFNVNYSQPEQKFVLSNPTIDINSLNILVVENSGADVLTYSRASSLFGQQSNSQIYFLQAAENEKYEVVFGDGVIGRKPADNAVVVCEYRVTKGELPNGARVFTSDGPIGGFSNVRVVTVNPASQGTVNETTEEIKFNAPRYYTSQERAITTEDYENLLKINFPEINDIIVYGGEEEDPPQYGKVFIVVDLKNVEGIPDIRKEQYYEFIKPRCSLAIDPVFVDPDFMYLDIDTTVRYNVNISALPIQSLKNAILNTIKTYNTTKLDKFNCKFRYSNFTTAIDNTDRSIVSNDTTIRAVMPLTPDLGIPKSYVIRFRQALDDTYSDLNLVHPVRHKSTIISSEFIYQRKKVFIEDDGQGILNLKTTSEGQHTNIRRVGSVNYRNGTLRINNLLIQSFSGDFIKFFARTRNKDVISSLRTLLTIREQDVSIRVIPIRE